MTGGQLGPTTLLGQVTTTSPTGRNVEYYGYPIKIAEHIALCDGTAYSARVSLDSVANIRKAKQVIKKAFEIQPGFTQALLSIALCNIDAGHYDAAIPPVTRFLYYNQQEDFGYFVRAKAYMGMSQYNDAETEINTAIALNDDIEYRYVHGIILYNKGSYARAKELLESLTEDIQTSDIYKYIGLCYFGLKDYNNALINLDKALILSDDDKFLLLKYNEVKSAMNGAASEQSEAKE